MGLIAENQTEIKELVFKGENSQVLTNSLLVAEKFGKSHDNVLKSIRNILSGGVLKNNETPMFAETTYYNEQNGQNYPKFVMNRDGFTLLAMGFTGKKAMQFKLDYISAFNKMEKALKEGQKKLSGAEFLLQQAQLMVEQERRMAAVEQRLDNMDRERKENGEKLLEAKLSDEKLPEMSMKARVNQLVREYAVATNTDFRDVWHKVYGQLYYLYHISIKSYRKLHKNETNLDIAVRNHFIDKIFTIVSNLIRENKAA